MLSFDDFRKMLDEMEKQIAAVVVCTPDRTRMPSASGLMEFFETGWLRTGCALGIMATRGSDEPTLWLSLVTRPPCPWAGHPTRP